MKKKMSMRRSSSSLVLEVTLVGYNGRRRATEKKNIYSFSDLCIKEIYAIKNIYIDVYKVCDDDDDE